MSDEKRVFVDTFPPISDVNREIQRTQNVLTEMLNRFASEDNSNTLEHALSALDGYCYVPVRSKLWPGRYCRYLNMSKSFNMKLMLGGFVVSDDGYTVTLKTTTGALRVSKRGCIWFMVMIDEDIKRIQMNSLLQ